MPTEEADPQLLEEWAEAEQFEDKEERDNAAREALRRWRLRRWSAKGNSDDQ